MSESGLAPGWYPHQATPHAMRYWDGQQWTDNLAPMAQPVTAEPSKVSDGLIVAGILTAVFLPIVGFVIGIIVATKGRPGWGVVTLIGSVVAAVFWYNTLSASPTYY